MFVCARIGARRIWTACANGPAHTCLVLEDDARFEQRELSLLVALFAGAFHSSAGDVDGGMRNAGAICRGAEDDVEGRGACAGSRGGNSQLGGDSAWDLVSLGVSALSASVRVEDRITRMEEELRPDQDAGREEGNKAREEEMEIEGGLKVGAARGDARRDRLMDAGELGAAMRGKGVMHSIDETVPPSMDGEGGERREEMEEEEEEGEEEEEETLVARMQWVRKPRALLERELSVRLLREGDLVRLCVSCVFCWHVRACVCALCCWRLAGMCVRMCARITHFNACMLMCITPINVLALPPLPPTPHPSPTHSLIHTPRGRTHTY